MTYTSFVFFIIYFGITFVLYTLCPRKFKWCVLLLGSWTFYAVASHFNVLPLILSTIVVWAAGIIIGKLDDKFNIKKKELQKPERKLLKAKYKQYKRAVLTVAVIVTLGILVFMKYFNFFGETVSGLFGLNVPHLKIIQPLGISFYTLQAVSYITDVYRGKYKPCKNPLRISLYLSFMMTIIEGPIARYDQLGTQLNNGKVFDFKDFSFGAQLVVWGLFKKIVIADRAAMLANFVFDTNNDCGGFVIILGVLFYTLQLYCDFSGVMDILSGLSEMMGIELPQNFTRPFFAKSINEFWQRWHISLGSWLRDYVFYPISLSKPFMKLSKSARKKFNPYYANLIPTSVALFFVWFSNGMWHGAGWKYIVYGLYYYFLMMLGLFLEPLSAKVCGALKINRDSKSFGIFRTVRTFIIVNFGMLIFRADDLKTVGSMVLSIFAKPSVSVLNLSLDLKDFAIIVIGVIILIVVGVLNEREISLRAEIAKLNFPLKFIIYLAFIFAVIIFGAYGENYGVQDLIYANF